LSSRDHQTLLVNALQLVELLLAKLPKEYNNALRREGVLHEIIAIADQDLSTKVKVEPPSSTSNTPVPEDGSPSAMPAPSGTSLPHRRSGQYIDSQDSTILRARIIRFKYLSSRSEDGADNEADGELGLLKLMTQRLTAADLNMESAIHALQGVADIFGRSNSPLSSFEMLKSGVIEALLAFASDATHACKFSITCVI
jgi:E3 ubiquitin-protein ligase TRIP12